MIVKDEVWVWSFNKNNKLKDPSTLGKWIVWGSKEFMEKIFPKINDLVDRGIIYRAKYAHRENKDADPFYDKKPVLIVYADDKSKQKTLKVLKELKIEPVRWTYESETEAAWRPGGKLYEEAKRRGYIVHD